MIEKIFMGIKILDEELKDRRDTKISTKATIEEYIDKQDWRISANSNTTYSAPGLCNQTYGKVAANYWLDQVYSKEEGNAHRNGDYHIHDLDIIGAYCCGHDLQKLLNEGFNGVKGRAGSKAPKHFGKALGQMANFIGILQGEWAGAQAFSSFDTFLSPILFYDIYSEGKKYKSIKSDVCGFVYNLNVPSRWGQSPFSNITIDLKCPNDLKDRTPMRNSQPFFFDVYEELKDDIALGKKYLEDGNNSFEAQQLIDTYTGWNNVIAELRKRLNDYETDEETLLYMVTYKIFEPEMRIIVRAYYEVLNEGDAFGLPFTFPIPTINIAEDFDWDNPEYNIIWEETAKYGSSYFQNFIGSQYIRDENGKLTIKDENAYSPNDVRSMCPLTLETEVLVRGNRTKTLKELNPDTDEVLAFELDKDLGKCNTFWSKFTKTQVFNDQDVLMVHINDGSVVEMAISHEQCVLSESGTLIIKKATHLKVGDKIAQFVKNGKYNIGIIDKIENIGVKPTQCITLINDKDVHQFVLGNNLVTCNCRLQLDKRALRKRGGGLFGSDAQTGSIGVVTINMARLGYLFKNDEKGLIKRLYHLMDVAKSTLEKKRKYVTEMTNRGLYPYTYRYVNSSKDGFTTFFSTIGINGVNEMIRNFTNDEHDITDEYGQNMAKKILNLIRDRLVQYQEETGNLFNLEATPAEGTTFRLAKEDNKRYGAKTIHYIMCEHCGKVEVEETEGEIECPHCKDSSKKYTVSTEEIPGIIQSGFEDAHYYTNSSQLPADFGEDVFSALDLQDDLQKMYTGGTVFHIYSEENVSGNHVKNLIRKVFENYRLPYVSYTASFSVCPKHGRVPGLHDFCPYCDNEILQKHISEYNPTQD